MLQLFSSRLRIPSSVVRKIIFLQFPKYSKSMRQPKAYFLRFTFSLWYQCFFFYRCNSVGKLYCRFVSFRKLKNSKNKYPSVVGFLDANKDSSERDVKMWKTLRSSYKSFGTKELVVGISSKNGVPLSKGSQGSHAPHKALFRLAQIGTALCQIIHQEQRVQRLYKDSCKFGISYYYCYHYFLLLWISDNF